MHFNLLQDWHKLILDLGWKHGALCGKRREPTELCLVCARNKGARHGRGHRLQELFFQRHPRVRVIICNIQKIRICGHDCIVYVDSAVLCVRPCHIAVIHTI